jgi:hypothetical protein
MVSEKVVVVLLIIAIILSVVSAVITISAIIKLPVPEVTVIQGDTEDDQQGKVSIIINSPGT